MTFTPEAARNYGGTITISGGGITKTVSLTGKGKGTITVTPTSLTFGNSPIGYEVTKTFNVKGSNLKNNLTITPSGSSCFSVSPTTITKAKAQSADGATVTVTYLPTGTSSNSATFTVSDNWTDDKEVTATGTGVKPTMTVSPTSLTFESAVGTTSLPQTITVTCANMPETPSVTLSQDIDGIFKITSNNLTKDGGSLKVTFIPEGARNYGGTITISGGGITKTVSLTGTGKTPTINVNPTSLTFTNVGVGTSRNQKFTVTGSNLTGNLTVAVSGNYYSVSPTTITPINGTVNQEVTVTYSPQAKGSHSGTVTVSGGGASSKTVSLSGTAILGGGGDV